ncbi:hypothetical protein ACFU1Q_11380 [Brachybacterium paraconglomeratum]|uniref:hypothetical protein n=1 Tax=Brachybacterium paraconglomeratum TaxID=173362 RepID=UPI00026C6F22|nr:hypothetical protein [Brachybacterium paraconglomeratum]
MKRRTVDIPEPFTFLEARDIRWKAQRGYRATPEETARLAFAAMTAAVDIHICAPDETGGLHR